MTTDAQPKVRVRIWDQMVLIGLGLALFYTVFESVLFIFLKVDVDMMQRLFGAGMSAIWGRLTILCLFVIFGSHAQYTINQRKQAESALRESEARFRLIVENAPVGYFELDLQGGFVFFNAAACRILGFPSGEMVEMHHRDFVGEDSRERIDAAFALVLEPATPHGRSTGCSSARMRPSALWSPPSRCSGTSKAGRRGSASSCATSPSASARRRCGRPSLRPRPQAAARANSWPT